MSGGTGLPPARASRNRKSLPNPACWLGERQIVAGAAAPALPGKRPVVGGMDGRGGWMPARKSGRGLPHYRTLRTDGGRLILTDGREFGCPADGQSAGLSVGRARLIGERSAGWETRDTADLEACGTKKPPRPCRRI